jgi:hypothetical protein
MKKEEEVAINSWSYGELVSLRIEKKSIYDNRFSSFLACTWR